LEDKMSCMQCGAEMVVTREDRPHADLPHVVLCGQEVRRCPSCGESEYVIQRMDELYQVLAGALVGKRARLAPEEIRFLRHTIGWAEAELAKELGVAVQSVARWESGADAMVPVADRLLRLIAARELGLRAPRELTAIVDTAEPLDVALRFGAEGWHIADRADPAEAWATATPEDRASVLEALAPEHFDERRGALAKAAIAVLRKSAAA
jgi:putative zinc finger/helix-turn-helix YgiT family protein